MCSQSLISHAKLLECAVEASKTAGSHALNNYSRRSDFIMCSAHDIKLKLDVECQQKAEEVIKAAFPAHAFLGEENCRANTGADEGYRWVVDPIDGTVNFSHGLPLWCCSIAVLYRGVPAAGAVFAPMMNELFTATADGPALCNGKTISVSKTARLDGCIVYTGADRNFDQTVRPLDCFRKVAGSVQRPRILGSAAYDICLVASGRGDGYIERDIYIWDVAAGELIVNRAGGEAEALSAYDKTWKTTFIATNGLIHKELKSVIAA